MLRFELLLLGTCY